MADTDIHTPVMLERCVELLQPGAAGARARCSSTRRSVWPVTPRPSSPGCRELQFVGLDRDNDALAIASRRLARFGDRVHLVHAVYDELAGGARTLWASPEVAGILFDLGVSSLQLDRVERGFSYSQDAPLDMRMDAAVAAHGRAWCWPTYSEGELRRIFFEYGEERLAPRYAKRIVRAPGRSPR